MPQLDTIYVFSTYLWVWLMQCLMMQKTKSFMMTTPPKINSIKTTSTMTLPWT